MLTTAEQEEIKKRERAIKVAQYKADFAVVFQKVSTCSIMCVQLSTCMQFSHCFYFRGKTRYGTMNCCRLPSVCY